MSKAAYPYPDDEFDTPADPDGPHGVHRAPRSRWRRWWPYLAIVVVVPVLAYGAVWFLGRSGVVADITGGGSSSSVGADSGSGDDSTASDGPTDAQSTPAGSPTSTLPASDGVVLSTPVTVTNAAGVSGLAGTTAKRLTVAGFTAVTTANGSKGSLTQSTVYYAKDAQAATAQQVAQTLGLTAVERSGQHGSAITVLLVAKLPD